MCSVISFADDLNIFFGLSVFWTLYSLFFQSSLNIYVEKYPI